MITRGKEMMQMMFTTKVTSKGVPQDVPQEVET